MYNIILVIMSWNGSVFSHVANTILYRFIYSIDLFTVFGGKKQTSVPWGW